MGRVQVEQTIARYGRVPEHLLTAEGVSGDECRLYALLTTYDWRQDHECHPTQQTLADRLGWSLRTVKRVIAALRERGAIEVVRQGRHPSLIRLLADLAPEGVEGYRRSSPDGPDLSPREVSIGQTRAFDGPDGESRPLTNEKERDRRERARAPRDDYYDVLVEVYGQPTRSGASFYAKVAGEVMAMEDASPDELRARALRSRERYGERGGPGAVAKNWPLLADRTATPKPKPLPEHDDRVFAGDLGDRQRAEAEARLTRERELDAANPDRPF